MRTSLNLFHCSDMTASHACISSLRGNICACAYVWTSGFGRARGVCCEVGVGYLSMTGSQAFASFTDQSDEASSGSSCTYTTLQQRSGGKPGLSLAAKGKPD